ncbi:MAG: hypothetical protein ACRDHF_01150 [Tepidiformaceae bacterium]
MRTRSSHRQFKHPTKPGTTTVADIPRWNCTPAPCRTSGSRQDWTNDR